ncbi:hypothetical protein [Pantoea sp. BAV 3049]|uniref:hypothetical protein n=1 Tax=Pantoea sp. BAV 3049 TaxID=2654188 RepID=UPI001E4A6EE8|nr:hypothetical protein [Pantoea sp. BAV 3049]
MLPLTHNANSFACHADCLPPALSREEESWGWLLHPAFAGRAALQDDAAMGALDEVLAVQGAGLVNSAMWEI